MSASRVSRVLRVRVTAHALQDGAAAPPVVGEVASYALQLVERTDTGPDATASLLRARAEPRDSTPPRQGRHWDGTPNPLPPTWPTIVHGDGWTAEWSAPRPVVGQVHLRGELLADLGPFGAASTTRGRITRAQVVTETYRRTSSGPPEWERQPSAQRLDEVSAAPRGFAHGLVRDPAAPPTGWGGMVAPDPWTYETGVLVDLDLDDAPPLPTRPSIVPGALAAHGADVWVVDEQLPLLVRLRGEQVLGVHPWPGGIVTGRRVHADASGCWVTGADGTLRVTLGGVVSPVTDERSWLATSSGSTLATQVILDPDDVHSPTALRLREPGSEARDVDLGGRHVAAVAAVPEGFLLLVTPADDHVHGCSLARLGLDGTVVIGPEVADDAHACHLVGGAHPALARGRGVHPVLDDLTLGEPAPVPGLVGACESGGRVWVLHHPADRVRVLWPADWPVRHLHKYWVLTELDPDTLSPLGSTPVPGHVGRAGVTDDGTVWVVAAGLRRCRGDGTPAERLDVAALLDAQSRPRWGWTAG